MTERELQHAVNAALRALQSTGRIRAWYHRPDRPSGHKEQPGLPDLILSLDSGLAVIELKGAKGKPRPKQEVWLQTPGDRTALCRSLDEVLAALRRWGVQA